MSPVSRPTPSKGADPKFYLNIFLLSCRVLVTLMDKKYPFLLFRQVGHQVVIFLKGTRGGYPFVEIDCEICKYNWSTPDAAVISVQCIS